MITVEVSVGAGSMQQDEKKSGGYRAFYRWLSQNCRSSAQVGKKGKSNHHWIVGVKWCPLVNARSEVVDWDWNTANEHDQVFRPVVKQYGGTTIILTDSGVAKADAPARSIKWRACGTWNDRMLIEIINSLLRYDSPAAIVTIR